MLETLLSVRTSSGLVLAAVLAGFVITLFAMKRSLAFLPKDQGRKFAVNGELSKGKARGAGLVFVIIFAVVSAVFVPLDIEKGIYYLLLVGAMLTGYLDDISKIPWGEWKKGLLDLVICAVTVITYVNFNDSDTYNIYIFNGISFEMPPALYIPIAVFFLWVSINVTNCTDGVDGLLGTLSAITFIALAIILSGVDGDYSQLCMIFGSVLLGYLAFNASPSLLLMGDAGSRAIGLFIGIAVLKTHMPLIYFFVAGVIFADGGIGLVKLLVLRILKAKNFLKNIRTPLHDHFRKNKGWSDTQTDTRFAILHSVLCLVGIWFFFYAMSGIDTFFY